MKTKAIIIFIICGCLLIGCTSSVGDKVAMGEVKYIETFPYSAKLNQISDFFCDEIGLSGVKYIDGLLILSHRNSWSILSDKANRNYGTCLTFGGGPNEFVYTPNCASAAYRTESDSLIAYICDKERGKHMRFNISKFVTNGKDSLECVFQDEKLNNMVWDAVAIGSDSVLMQVPTDDFTGFQRIIISSDSLWEPESTKGAATAKVESPNLNILAKVSRCRPDGKKCVEAMLFLNQLNVFDTDGSQAMTICIGEELDDVNYVESKWDLARKETYETVAAWDFGFGALFGGSVWDKLGFKSNDSKIQFFTWEGIPVFEAELPIQALSFDLNLSSGVLYAINAKEDELVAFDASDILDAYQRVLARI